MSALRTAGMIAALLCALVLSSCGGSDDEARVGGPNLVALGDSAVAGAGIGPTSPPCHSSRRNYPSVVADALGVDDFVDASCIGATTQDVLGAQTTDDGSRLSAQITSVRADTDVVTISIGGNDGGLVPRLFNGCYSLQGSAATCRAAVAGVRHTLGTTQQDIVTTLAAIRAKAPDALVVLVGYLRIMPDSGTCDPAVIRISSTDLIAAAAAEGQLEGAMRAGAEQAGVDYVDMHALSDGHDACAGDEDAWVSGATAKPGDGTFLHPRVKGARAVARAVEPVVRSQLVGR